MKLPPPEDRKPSVMLAEMLEYCPAGESATAVFAYLFLQQLCRETQVLLSKDNPADMRAIVDKADHLITLHVPKAMMPALPARMTRIWTRWQPVWAPGVRR